jgi:hypothetical protein
MRHPHGLRAAAGVDTGLAIGEAYEGGFLRWLYQPHS